MTGRWGLTLLFLCTSALLAEDRRAPEYEITNTSRRPYSWIGLFTKPFNYGKLDSHDCTGTLISPRHVLTAAHCVLGHGLESFSKQLYFVLGPNRWSVKRAFFPREYLEAFPDSWWGPGFSRPKYQETLDYAVLELAEATDLGFIGRGLYPFELQTPEVCLSGYPISHPGGTLWESCGSETRETQTIFPRLDKVRGAFFLTGYSGQSGSALRWKDTAVGVFTMTMVQFDIHYSIGIRFGNEELAQIQKWLNGEGPVVEYGTQGKALELYIQEDGSIEPNPVLLRNARGPIWLPIVLKKKKTVVFNGEVEIRLPESGAPIDYRLHISWDPNSNKFLIQPVPLPERP